MAPKKKKSGKANKMLAKMSEEERILYQEQMRLQEEEAKKKKEDMLTQFLKDKLAKEEKATRFNLNKLNHQWRNMMREAKSKELKKDIEILSQTFERIVDRKESVIKSLAKDLQEAEEQYAMTLRSHVQNQDYLIDLERQRLSTLSDEYREELEALKREFNEERSLLLEQHQKEMSDISDIIFAMEQQFQDREQEARSEFQSLRDEIRNKNMEEKHALRVNLESKADNLWEQFKKTMEAYKTTTEDRKTAFESLKLKDERSARDIDMQMRKLQRIADQITMLKNKMAQNAKENEERNRQLRNERERMTSLFHDLKRQMSSIRDSERQKLQRLTVKVTETAAALKAKVQQGEAIVRLSEQVRKLTTEEEKVLPFYASSLTPEEQEDVNAAVAEPPSESLAAAMHDYTALENFWKRYNKVTLERCALDREKHVLLTENSQLRSLLKQYLDGISVNDEVLSTTNPLFVVNQKTNVKIGAPMLDPRMKRPAQVVIEAAHVAKHLPAN